MIHVDLTTKIGDFLELENPYWISSAHYSHKDSVVKAWKELSPSALTLKTSDVDPREENKKIVRERTYRILPRYGRSFYCDGPKQEELLTYQKTEELLNFATQELPNTKIGISVLSSSEQDYTELRKRCSKARFCELNLKYSFRIKHDQEYLAAALKTFDAILAEISRFLEAFKDLPAFVKISRELAWLPGSAEFLKLVDCLASHGKAGLIVANSLKTDIPAFIAAGVEWDLKGGVLCGETLFDQTITMLQKMNEVCARKKVPLVATGGMLDPEHTILAIRAGASAVQLCTAFDYKGLNFYRTLIWNLQNRIKSRGLRSFREYAERIREEGVASVYSMPFTYYERFWDDEAQSELRADVTSSGRLDIFVMSGQTLVTKWKDVLQKRFGKNLKVRFLLPHPDGSIFTAIQKAWGISEENELSSRKRRLRKTVSDLRLLADQSGSEKNLARIAFTDKCPFFSLYIVDDKVYVAPYPFTLLAGADMPVPVYVFIAGSPEFSRLEQEFEALYKLAEETTAPEIAAPDLTGGVGIPPSK